jgi:hypothetical protein
MRICKLGNFRVITICALWIVARSRRRSDEVAQLGRLGSRVKTIQFEVIHANQTPKTVALSDDPQSIRLGRLVRGAFKC